MKVRQQSSLLIAQSFEVDGEHSASRLQNASNLVYALLSRFLRQMMEHNSAKYEVELRLGEWKSLRHATPENDLHAGAPRLSLCPGEHLGRGVDTVHRTA